MMHGGPGRLFKGMVGGVVKMLKMGMFLMS